MREALKNKSFEPACCLSAGKKRKRRKTPSLFYLPSLLAGDHMFVKDKLKNNM
jgi:hypothetical protein